MIHKRKIKKTQDAQKQSVSADLTPGGRLFHHQGLGKQMHSPLTLTLRSVQLVWFSAIQSLIGHEEDLKLHPETDWKPVE